MRSSPTEAQSTCFASKRHLSEKRVANATDERRLRAQRRYFGMSNHGGGFATSIPQAKALGERAAERVHAVLSEPFTVYTGFADARGAPQFKRIYGFVETAAGDDLAELLVAEGLARAFGVSRQRSESVSGDEYRSRLADFELQAAKAGAGAWAFTDWEALPAERSEERREEEQVALAMRGPALPPAFVDPNAAPRPARPADGAAWHRRDPRRPHHRGARGRRLHTAGRPVARLRDRRGDAGPNRSPSSGLRLALVDAEGVGVVTGSGRVFTQPLHLSLPPPTQHQRMAAPRLRMW